MTDNIINEHETEQWYTQTHIIKKQAGTPQHYKSAKKKK
jgi:hypothetical protein